MKILKFKTFNEGVFNRIPDFEFDSKVKKISFKINNDKIEAYVGASTVYEEEENNLSLNNNYYFRTDSENANLMRKNEIKSIENIDEKEEIISFVKNDGNIIMCKFKVKFFSKKDIEWDYNLGDDYVSWRF